MEPVDWPTSADLAPVADFWGLDARARETWRARIRYTVAHLTRGRAATLHPLGPGMTALCAHITGDGAGDTVARFSPAGSLLADEEAALSWWGPPAVTVVDHGDGWTLLDWLGPWTDRRDEPGADERALCAIAALHARGVPDRRFGAAPSRLVRTFRAATLLGGHPDRFAHLGTRAERAHWADAGPDTWAALVDEAGRFWPPALCHGDLHARNLFDDGHQVTVIDPSPTVAPAGTDVAGWVACGGTSRIRRRLAAWAANDPATVPDRLRQRLVAAVCRERAVSLSWYGPGRHRAAARLWDVAADLDPVGRR
jgi:hypothetical protein